MSIFNSAANQYLKFAIGGFFGTIINLLVFYCLFNIFNTNLNVASVFAFIIACANNFILNFVVHTFGDSVALMGQLAGILLGSISNFFFSRKLVF